MLQFYISLRCLNCVQSAVVLVQNIIPTQGILEDLGLLVDADLGERTMDFRSFRCFLQLRSTRHFSLPQRRQFPERLPQWAPDPPPLTAEDIKILAAF